MNDSLVSVRCLVVEKLFFAFSFGKSKQALEEAQIFPKLPVQQLRLKSKSLCCSWYWSLKRILDQKPAIKRVLMKHRYSNFALPPSQEQYDVISDICQLIEPLVDIIEKSSNYKHAIVSTLLPLMKQITDNFEENSADSAVVAGLKVLLKVGLKINLSINKTSFALKATCLDPRFKDFLEPDEQQEVLCELTSEAAKITNNPTTSNACAGGDINDETMSSLYEFLRFEINQFTGDIPTEDQQISNEVDNYLADPAINKDKDPLEWWRTKQLQCKHLSMLAGKYSIYVVPLHAVMLQTHISNTIGYKLLLRAVI